MAKLIVALVIALAGCADPESAVDEQLFEAWVPYATGSPACPALAAPERTERLAAAVRAGDAQEALDLGDSCAVAHLIEDAGGVNLGRDGDPQGNEHACHGMGPGHRALLRRVLAASL